NRNALTVLREAQRENATLMRLHMLFQIRACAEIAAHRDAEAGEDLLTGLRLANLARQIPDTTSSISTQVLLTRSLQPLWEGIVQHRWTEPQLVSFQNELRRF